MRMSLITSFVSAIFLATSAYGEQIVYTGGWSGQADFTQKMDTVTYSTNEAPCFTVKDAATNAYIGGANRVGIPGYEINVDARFETLDGPSMAVFGAAGWENMANNPINVDARFETLDAPFIAVNASCS